MIAELVVIRDSANVDEITVTAWLKSKGSVVSQGDPLVEITTDKACIEIESPASGTLLDIFADEKSVVPIGFTLALIGEDGDPVPDIAERNRKLLEDHKKSIRPVRDHGKPQTTAAAGVTKVRATPAARRLARKHGLDLEELQKTMQTDVITESALQAHIETGHAETGGPQ